MFTGLIETLGTITSITRHHGAWNIGIMPAIAGFDVAPGGSVSVDGACLTLESAGEGKFFFSAVQETLERTTLGTARQGRLVNLERPLQVGGRLDGHWVLGHVDGIGRIRGIVRNGESAVVTIEVPPRCVPYMAEKGSVAIDGISLTIAASGNGTIDVAVIPATLGATTLGSRKHGDEVNVEADMVARYLHSLLQWTGNAPAEGLLSKMERLGF